MYLRSLAVTTEEVTVGVLWADALRAKIADAQNLGAFLIMAAREPSAELSHSKS
jgi:hypothetical protein